MPGTIVWFRNDLRLQDNPALVAAVERNKPVLPVFVWEESSTLSGIAGNWWLINSLRALQTELQARGSDLIIRKGTFYDVLRILLQETKADAVFFNRRYEPGDSWQDERIISSLQQDGFKVQTFPGNLLIEPWQMKGKNGRPFRVFTSFWKTLEAVLSQESDSQRKNRCPSRLDHISFPKKLRSLPLDNIHTGLEQQKASQFQSSWKPGEKAAQAKLRSFINESVYGYSNNRNWLDAPGTSRLSFYLHFGEISCRQIWSEVKVLTRGRAAHSCRAFLRQLAWREFAYHLLWNFPHSVSKPLQTKFEHFPYRYNQQAFTAWATGKTGYPLVDAGMRQLWNQGWIHNRMRMIVASFLVKDLLQPWQDGATWFMKSLLDADLANNSLGWQWVSGCGADAAPYFRIFNPVLQSEKFDANGIYIKRWLPELALLPEQFIHEPWKAPKEELKRAHIELGDTYPYPLVDHDAARQHALEVFNCMLVRR